MGTPMKLLECNSMVNDTRWWVYRARAHVQLGQVPFLCNKIRSTFELKHSYVYEFDPKAVQSSSADL